MKKIMVLVLTMTGLLAQANAADIGYACKGKSKAFTVEISETGEDAKVSFETLENGNWTSNEDYSGAEVILLPTGGMTIVSTRSWASDCTSMGDGPMVCLAIARPVTKKIIHIWGRGATSVEGSVGFGSIKNEEIRFKFEPETEVYNCYITK